MQNTISTVNSNRTSLVTRLKNNGAMLISFTLLLLLPFAIALFEGQSISTIFNNEAGNAKFFQGLLIEVFILAIFALSYDLVLGITGILSFGHAMFFAAGAYFTGIAFKSFEWGLAQTLA